MRTFYKYIILFVSISVAASCVKDNVDNTESGIVAQPERVAVNVSFSTVAEQTPDGTVIPYAEGAVTRAPSDIVEHEYHNIWAFQFNGTGEDAILIDQPTYIDNATIEQALSTGTNVPFTLLASNGDVHRLVFVANINNRNYDWGLVVGRSSYQDFKSKYLVITNESPTYGREHKNLIMSGTITSPIASGTDIDNGSAGVSLERVFAKIEMSIGIDAANYKVISATVMNIPQRVAFLDNQLGLDGSEIYPNNFSSEYFNYQPDRTEIESGSSHTYKWYVPRNTKGVVANSATSKDKRKYAPSKATYVEVIALDDAGAQVRYVIYVGANNTDDYNVIPNRKYIINLNIKGKDDADIDSRVDSYEEVVFDGRNNSFIVNPPREGVVASRKFTVPVIRVKDYWEDGTPGYGGGLDLPESYTWKVDLLWQDRQDMVRASGEDASKYIILTQTTGTGFNTSGFSFEVPAGIPHGNFVIALTPSGGGSILWSWHFWVTDYNPDTKNVEIDGHRWVYNVEGGDMLRLGGACWGYNSAGAAPSNNWNNYNYVGVSSASAPLAKGFIMDRPIGALDPMDERPLMYQYGRKDPFPSNSYTLYDIAGNQVAYSNSANAVDLPVGTGPTIKESIESPLSFFKASTGIWSRLPYNKSCIWNDLKLGYNDASDENYTNKDGRFGKSIFDPCPQGWVMAVDENVWADLRYGTTVANDDRGLLWDKYRHKYYYWPEFETGGTTPVMDKITFASYYKTHRIWNTGIEDINKVLTYGFVTHNSKFLISGAGPGGNVAFLQFSDASVTNPYTVIATRAIPVRCVAW